MTTPGFRPIPTESDAYAGRYPTKALEKFMDEILDFVVFLEREHVGRNEVERMTMAAALAASFRDWEKAKRRVRRRQRELDDEEE